jgi:hypothetical protein
MPVTTNTRKLAALLGASGAGIGTDGLLQAAGVDANIATQAELDASDNKITTNLAVLAIRQAADHNDVKYSLQDRIIDDYYDASGIDGTPSTNHTLASGVYSGSLTPTVTEDADVGPTVDGDYTYYKWTDTGSTGSYTSDTTQDHEYLVVAGGGGGGRGYYGGGGGAGGYLAGTGVSYASASTFTITVGAGGGGSSSTSADAPNGGLSSIVSSGSETTVSSVGGGGGASRDSGVGATGGSGGGAAQGGNAGGAGTAGPPRQGYDGGTNGSGQYGGGGGGAGEAGNAGGSGPYYGAQGGDGVQNDIDGTNRYYAGGGGGGAIAGGASGYTDGGQGGGGQGGHYATGGNGTDGLGGGGGAGGDTGSNGGDGGNGIVIIRRLTKIIGDLILQSTDTTAETEPDYADMVTLIEDAGGTPAVINTDIKGFISEDSGVTFTEGVLVDEGDWGTNKRILAFHDLDISAQSGTAMCYKITTHNQSASKETKIHATSIGWRE